MTPTRKIIDGIIAELEAKQDAARIARDYVQLGQLRLDEVRTRDWYIIASK